jgi:hypothetical protein
MARPQVADGGDGLRIRRVAADIFYKQSRTADKGWFTSSEVWRGAESPQSKKISMLRNITKGLGLGSF